jgi:hypothetical protein
MRWLPLVFPTVLVGVAVAGLLGLLAWAAARTRPAAGGSTLLLRYNPLFRGFVAAAAVLLPVGLTALVLAFPPRPREVGHVVGLYFAFAAITLPLVWEAAWYYVRLTPAGIEHRSPWRGLRFVRWADVRQVTFNPANAWFVIHARDGRPVRAHVWVADLPELLRQVERHVPASALKGARTGYARVGRPFPPLPDEPVLEARPPRP